jgi:hypothetical protein
MVGHDKAAEYPHAYGQHCFFHDSYECFLIRWPEEQGLPSVADMSTHEISFHRGSIVSLAASGVVLSTCNRHALRVPLGKSLLLNQNQHSRGESPPSPPAPHAQHKKTE